MTNNNRPIEQGRFIRYLPGLLISVVAFAVIFYLVDWREVLSALNQVDYKYLSIGIPIYLIAYGFRALAWQTLLGKEISFQRVFLTMQAGYLLNNLLPFRLGELGRAFLLGRTGLGFWRVLSTILIERAFDMILAAGLFIGTVPFVLGTPRTGQASYIVGIVVTLGLFILFLLTRYQEWAIIQYEKLTNRWSIFARFGVQRVQAFFNGLSALVHFSKFARVLFWMLGSWALAIIYQYLLLLSFESTANILWAAFGLATASLGVALPSSPSYVGVFEAAWVGALTLFQVSPSTALAYALMIHVIHILVSCLFGLPALAREGETLSHIYAEITKKRFA